MTLALRLLLLLLCCALAPAFGADIASERVEIHALGRMASALARIDADRQLIAGKLRVRLPLGQHIERSPEPGQGTGERQADPAWGERMNLGYREMTRSAAVPAGSLQAGGRGFESHRLHLDVRTTLGRAVRRRP